MAFEGPVLLKGDAQVLDPLDPLDLGAVQGVVLFFSHGKVPKSYVLRFVWVDDHLVVLNPLVDSCKQPLEGLHLFIGLQGAGNLGVIHKEETPDFC